MEAAVWTAIGILAASQLGTLFHLGSRIDALGARIDASTASLNARIDALDGRLGARVDALGAKLDEHIARHAG
jgi:hypothetical protein